MPKKKHTALKTSSSTHPSLETDQMKTEFVYIASHQLRTPLTAIKLLIELLLSDPSVQMHAEQAEYLKHISASTDRMVQLVDDLLNVSRIETGTLRVVPVQTNLKQFVQSIVKELDPIAKEKNGTIRLISKETLRPLMIDQGLMHAVFHNLIVNAIKYSRHDKCFVDIVLKKMKTAQGSFIQVQINDRGIGIPKKEQDRIFEKFFRAENAIQIQTDGSGLGLYIAQKIANLSDAKLGFQPLKDGTRFYVNLPVTGSTQKQGTRTIRPHK